MLNWNEFDRMIDEMFSSFNRKPSFDDKGWTRKTYKSPDSGFYYTYLSKTNKKENQTDEIELLKEKLEIAVEEQKFEEAVELRDKISSLEKNKEKILELKEKLNECIKNQNFEKAIEYRDKITNLK
jgi:protein-arginine kinase activator protein McsA|tara:strand:+ start:338 stop:715 length:378 start_codon:yes stop_codon:yes gene_type:complete